MGDDGAGSDARPFSRGIEEGRTSAENQPRERWADVESDHENPKGQRDVWEHFEGEYIAEFETHPRSEEIANPDEVFVTDWMGEIERAIEAQGSKHLWNRTLVKGFVRKAMLVTRRALPMVLCMHRREFRAAGKIPQELIGVIGQLLKPQDVENALVTAMCRAGENVGTAGTEEGLEIILIAVGLRPDVTSSASLGFKRNLYLCFAGMVRELCSKLDDTFNKIWDEMNATVRVLGPNNDDREAGDDYWCFDGGIEVDTYEEVPFARVRQNRSLWYELVVEALEGLRDSLTANEELQVAGEYIIRFMRFQREFYFKRARETFRAVRTNYLQGPRAFLREEAYFKEPIGCDEIDTLLDMVNVDPETCWHEGLGSALELMGFVYDFSGTEAGIQLPAALAENVFKDMAEAATRIKNNILLRREPHQLELEKFARYKLPEGSMTTPRESEAEGRSDAEGDSKMEPVEERREERQAPPPGDMAPPSFIPSRRREAAAEGGEASNPGTNKLPRPPITRQDPSIPAEGLPIAEGLEGRPGGNERELTREDDDPMGEGEDENTSGFDRASFRARNFGRPDSEDEAMLQDAARWEPDRKPAKPTTVVRKAVIDDLWNQRGSVVQRLVGKGRIAQEADPEQDREMLG